VDERCRGTCTLRVAPGDYVFVSRDSEDNAEHEKIVRIDSRWAFEVKRRALRSAAPP